MSLKEVMNRIAGGLEDLHVGLNRARHFASRLAIEDRDTADNFMELYEELDQMQREIERLMKEVE